MRKSNKEYPGLDDFQGSPILKSYNTDIIEKAKKVPDGTLSKNKLYKKDSSVKGGWKKIDTKNHNHIEHKVEEKKEVETEEAKNVDFFVNEANSHYDEKDMNRIIGIFTRANDNFAKLKQLTIMMAGKIDDSDKAIRRGYAVLAHPDKNKEIAQIFFNRAGELGYKEKPIEKDWVPKTRVSTEEPRDRSPDRRYQKNGASVAPIGSVNLKTGSSKWFNIYETWGENVTYEVYQETYGNKNYRIVAIFGSNPFLDIGDTKRFQSDQQQRFLFNGTLVDWCNGSELKKLAKIYGNNIPMYAYK